MCVHFNVCVQSDMALHVDVYSFALFVLIDCMCICVVANLFAQVVCLLHLHTKSWTAMPVETRPISEQGVMESPSNGGAMIATNFAFRSMKEWPMTLRNMV